MIMAVKHQVLMSPNPRHLIMVTLNHLDAMTDYATNPVTKKNIHTTYELLIQVMLHIYGHTTSSSHSRYRRLLIIS